jgi:hypothetical protein
MTDPFEGFYAEPGYIDRAKEKKLPLSKKAEVMEISPEEALRQRTRHYREREEAKARALEFQRAQAAQGQRTREQRARRRTAKRYGIWWQFIVGSEKLISGPGYEDSVEALDGGTSA